MTTLNEYFSKNMVSTQDFSDIELDVFLDFFRFHGVSMYHTVESFRHPTYYCITILDDGNFGKCVDYKPDRTLVSKQQVIDDLKLGARYQIFREKPPAVVVVNDKEKVLNVFCSGSPNYFIYGVENDTQATYSFINNQYWVRSSNNLTITQTDDMILVAVGEKVFVN